MPEKRTASWLGPHRFHIPVMGTGFTIDTPLKVARYGISSVVSLVDDVLIERMRAFYARQSGEPFHEIPADAEDSRARRITSYLNLLGQRVREQLERLRETPFEPGAEITRYFELLPPSPLKLAYERMLTISDPEEKRAVQDSLRLGVRAGQINVNIMTKLDRARYVDGEKAPSEQSDALSALRGFASSTLRSSVIFSAGLNRKLYSYLTRFDDFFPDTSGEMKKQIVLKVSDCRSALIQGRFLARMGLWVSEFRIESGLNCGGHAFATQGLLMGPILDEFRQRRQELSEQFHKIWRDALKKIGRESGESMPEQRLTVQGGIGTNEEHTLLMDHFGVDGTGWATPFLLVPSVVNIDAEHLTKLAAAKPGDVYLSDSSPLGIPFWNLRNSASEEARRDRIRRNAPGSTCPKGFLAMDEEYAKVPICKASRGYQRRKLATLTTQELPGGSEEANRTAVLRKSCICHELSGTAPQDEHEAEDIAIAICPGPNIVNFRRSYTLDEMAGHIYGRRSVLEDESRPHMFVREFSLYVEFLDRELEKRRFGLGGGIKSLQEYRDNLLAGVEFYRAMAQKGLIRGRQRFLDNLNALVSELESLMPVAPVVEEAS
jgi:hypothetical protein